MLDNIKRDEHGRYYPRDDYKLYNTNGGCACIYKKHDILKIYHTFIPDYLRIVEDTFNILKDINETNFIKLYDYYIDNNKIVAYTSKFIEHIDNYNILEMDKELVKYNLIKLDKLILLICKANIIIDDINYRNYLLSNEELVLIDPDCYRYNTFMDEEALIDFNYRKFLESFKDIYNRSFYKTFYKSSGRYNICSVAFNKMTEELFHSDSIENICKRINTFKLEKR